MPSILRVLIISRLNGLTGLYFSIYIFTLSESGGNVIGSVLKTSNNVCLIFICCPLVGLDHDSKSVEKSNVSLRFPPSPTNQNS